MAAEGGLVKGRQFSTDFHLLCNDHINYLHIIMNYQKLSTTANYKSCQLPTRVLVNPVIARRILRLKQVIEITGLSRSAIYDRLDSKSRRYDAWFPKQLKLGTSSNAAVGWVEGEIMDWLERCCAVR